MSVVISGAPVIDAVDSPVSEAGSHAYSVVLFSSFFLRPFCSFSFFFIDPIGLSALIPDKAYVHGCTVECIVLLPAFSCPVASLATDVACIGVTSPFGLVVLF